MSNQYDDHEGEDHHSLVRPHDYENRHVSHEKELYANKVFLEPREDKERFLTAINLFFLSNIFILVFGAIMLYTAISEFSVSERNVASTHVNERHEDDQAKFVLGLSFAFVIHSVLGLASCFQHYFRPEEEHTGLVNLTHVLSFVCMWLILGIVIVDAIFWDIHQHTARLLKGLDSNILLFLALTILAALIISMNGSMNVPYRDYLIRWTCHFCNISASVVGVSIFGISIGALKMFYNHSSKEELKGSDIFTFPLVIVVYSLLICSVVVFISALVTFKLVYDDKVDQKALKWAHSMYGLFSFFSFIFAIVIHSFTFSHLTWDLSHSSSNPVNWIYVNAILVYSLQVFLLVAAISLFQLSRFKNSYPFVKD